MTMSTLLRHAREGGYIYGTQLQCQDGFRINDHRLSFDGRWILKSIACLSSADLGLGTCRCMSHSPWDVREISRADALAHLRAVLADASARETEMACLDQAIADATPASA